MPDRVRSDGQTVFPPGFQAKLAPNYTYVAEGPATGAPPGGHLVYISTVRVFERDVVLKWLTYGPWSLIPSLMSLLGHSAILDAYRSLRSLRD
jgi:hypothetical protein